MSERSLIPKEPAFMVEASQSIEKLMEYAKLYLKSGLAPDHFHGKPEAVVIAVQQGLSIGMTTSQALQQIVVIKGTATIKGDGAKALIMGSGLCGSWIEKETGSIETDDFTVEITSTRKDNNSTISKSFSIADAKRAGLWVSEEAVKRDSRKGSSAWYKFPKRMIAYRALGFLARDLYPDVMQGTVTYEEAQDYDFNKAEVVTPSGKTTIKTRESATGAIASVMKTVTKNKDKVASDAAEAEEIESEEVVNETEPVETEEQNKQEETNIESPVEIMETQFYTQTYLEDIKLTELEEICSAKGVNPKDYKGGHTKEKVWKLILRAQAGSLGEIEKHKVKK